MTSLETIIAVNAASTPETNSPVWHPESFPQIEQALEHLPELDGVPAGYRIVASYRMHASAVPGGIAAHFARNPHASYARVGGDDRVVIWIACERLRTVREPMPCAA
jgi:hypothetical protein